MYRPRRKTNYLTAAVLWLALMCAGPGRFGAAWSATPSPDATAPSASATATASPSATSPAAHPSASASAGASATSTPVTHPTAHPSATAPPEPPSLQSALSAMGKIQVLVEFYYMNTGTYPVNLEELNTQYNQNVPKGGARATLPLDPATNKPFVYQPGDDGKSYSIKPPNPAAYGVAAIELSNIDWGWMKGIAEEHQREQLAQLCGIYIKGLANALDKYAQENKNTLPDSLDNLVPKYVKKLPNCPGSNKPFLYRKTDRGYVISCPDPKSHGLEVLEYSSTEGFKSR